MLIYNIEVMIQYESKLSIQFLNQLIKIITTDESSIELSIWLIYDVTHTQFNIVCCSKIDIFNIELFKEYLLRRIVK